MMLDCSMKLLNLLVNLVCRSLGLIPFISPEKQFGAQKKTTIWYTRTCKYVRIVYISNSRLNYSKPIKSILIALSTHGL